MLFPEIKEYRLPFALCNQEHNLTFSSDMLVIVVELPKFSANLETIKSPLDAWLYFLCKTDELDSKHLPNSIDSPENDISLNHIL